MSDDTPRSGSASTGPRRARSEETQTLETSVPDVPGEDAGEASAGRAGSGSKGRHANGPVYGGPGADRGTVRARQSEGAVEPGDGAPTTVLPGSGGRPARPGPARPEARPGSAARAPSRAAGRRRARLALQRIDPWSVFLFSLVASICLGVVLLAAVASLYAALSSLGVLDSLNGVLGEVAGSGAPDEVVEPLITSSRVLSAAAVLAAVDVVLLTALATLGALLYNLCASLTGGIEVQLGERD